MYMTEGETRKNYCCRLSAAEADALKRVAANRRRGLSATLRELVIEAAAALDNTDKEKDGTL